MVRYLLYKHFVYYTNFQTMNQKNFVLAANSTLGRTLTGGGGGDLDARRLAWDIINQEFWSQFELS